ncbi:MAG: hypothetical protein RQ758_05615 [Methanomicrobiaceae archaeon]|nr:hypothetical protein [Methanomicrobiaceae archaeon]
MVVADHDIRGPGKRSDDILLHVPCNGDLGRVRGESLAHDIKGHAGVDDEGTSVRIDLAAEPPHSH